MKYYVYILKSEKDGGYYFGSTQNVEERLERNNAGSVKSTKYLRPLKLYYFEECKTKKEGEKREKFFKTYSGYLWLKKII